MHPAWLEEGLPGRSSIEGFSRPWSKVGSCASDEDLSGLVVVSIAQRSVMLLILIEPIIESPSKKRNCHRSQETRYDRGLATVVVNTSHADAEMNALVVRDRELAKDLISTTCPDEVKGVGIALGRVGSGCVVWTRKM